MISNSALRFVDTHCHLNLDDFDSDRLQVIERARSNGIFKIIIPGIDIATCKSALIISHDIPDIFIAVGVHPNSGQTWDDGTITKLRQMVSDPKVVAVGEIGLDYYRDYTPHELQQRVLIQQLELAAELCLPVIIHNRDATHAIVGILQNWVYALEKSGSSLAQHPGVMHSFSADVNTAKTMLELNFKIGITGPVTYKNARELHSVVAFAPLESLLVETDAPFLTPHPYRGQRNEPANVRIVAEKIAEIKQVPIDEVARITTETANQLFDWRVVH